MNINKTFYWLSRFLLLLLFSSLIFFSSVALAVTVVRVLPFINSLLSANLNAIAAGPGANFISAAYSLEGSNALTGNLRSRRMLPLMVGVAILRRLKPVDAFFRRFLPHGNPGNTTNPISEALDMPIPDSSQVFSDDGSILTGVVPGDQLQSYKGRFINWLLALIFLIIVLFFVMITAMILKAAIDAFNVHSKRALKTSVELGQELRQLPKVINEEYSPPAKKPLLKTVKTRKSKSA